MGENTLHIACFTKRAAQMAAQLEFKTTEVAGPAFTKGCKNEVAKQTTFPATV